MAQALGGKGDVGLVFHAADFFVTKQRYDAFKATIAENYPDIKIVAEQGIGGPDFAGDAEKAASCDAGLQSDASRASGRSGTCPRKASSRRRLRPAATILSSPLSTSARTLRSTWRRTARQGLGAQRPYDQGVTEAMLAGYGLLGKEAPAYVALPALPVTKENLLEAWQQVYHKPLTDKITQEHAVRCPERPEGGHATIRPARKPFLKPFSRGLAMNTIDCR